MVRPSSRSHVRVKKNCDLEPPSCDYLVKRWLFPWDHDFGDPRTQMLKTWFFYVFLANDLMFLGTGASLKTRIESAALRRTYPFWKRSRRRTDRGTVIHHGHFKWRTWRFEIEKTCLEQPLYVFWMVDVPWFSFMLRENHEVLTTDSRWWTHDVCIFMAYNPEIMCSHQIEIAGHPTVGDEHLVHVIPVYSCTVYQPLKEV